MSFLSIRVKIFVSLVLVTLLFGLSMIVFTELFIYRKLQDMSVDKGVSIAKRIGMDCINPILTERYFEITMIFNDLLRTEKGILYAYALDEDGRTVAHTLPRGVPSELLQANRPALNQSFTTKEISTDWGRVTDVAIPLMDGQAGVLHLGLSDEGILRDVKEIEGAILAFAFTILIVGAMTSFWFSNTITRPILKLASAAEAFGRGYMPEKALPVDSEDEVGELARIFDTMIERRRLAEMEREQLIAEIQAAMSKVKTLSGLLPICASCKKIRDDKGYWNQIESYISEHTQAEFSHGICPDCMKTLYPELLDKDGNLIRHQKS